MTQETWTGISTVLVYFVEPLKKYSQGIFNVFDCQLTSVYDQRRDHNSRC